MKPNPFKILNTYFKNKIPNYDKNFNAKKY